MQIPEQEPGSQKLGEEPLEVSVYMYADTRPGNIIKLMSTVPFAFWLWCYTQSISELEI